MGAQLAHAEDDHMLRLAAAPADGRAELRAMPWIKPLISQVDAGIGQVGKVATGFNQIRLATDIAPDDAQLLTIAVTPQAPPQFFIIGALLKRLRQLAAQFARPKAAFQLTA